MSEWVSSTVSGNPVPKPINGKKAAHREHWKEDPPMSVLWEGKYGDPTSEFYYEKKYPHLKEANKDLKDKTKWKKTCLGYKEEKPPEVMWPWKNTERVVTVNIYNMTEKEIRFIKARKWHGRANESDGSGKWATSPQTKKDFDEKSEVAQKIWENEHKYVIPNYGGDWRDNRKEMRPEKYYPNPFERNAYKGDEFYYKLNPCRPDTDIAGTKKGTDTVLQNKRDGARIKVGEVGVVYMRVTPKFSEDEPPVSIFTFVAEFERPRVGMRCMAAWRRGYKKRYLATIHKVHESKDGPTTYDLEFDGPIRERVPWSDMTGPGFGCTCIKGRVRNKMLSTKSEQKDENAVQKKEENVYDEENQAFVPCTNEKCILVTKEIWTHKQLSAKRTTLLAQNVKGKELYAQSEYTAAWVRNFTERWAGKIHKYNQNATDKEKRQQKDMFADLELLKQTRGNFEKLIAIAKKLSKGEALAEGEQPLWDQSFKENDEEKTFYEVNRADEKTNSSSSSSSSISSADYVIETGAEKMKKKHNQKDIRGWIWNRRREWRLLGKKFADADDKPKLYKALIALEGKLVKNPLTEQKDFRLQNKKDTWNFQFEGDVRSGYLRDDFNAETKCVHCRGKRNTRNEGWKQDKKIPKWSPCGKCKGSGNKNWNGVVSFYIGVGYSCLNQFGCDEGDTRPVKIRNWANARGRPKDNAWTTRTWIRNKAWTPHYSYEQNKQDAEKRPKDHQYRKHNGDCEPVGEDCKECKAVGNRCLDFANGKCIIKDCTKTHEGRVTVEFEMNKRMRATCNIYVRPYDENDKDSGSDRQYDHLRLKKEDYIAKYGKVPDDWQPMYPDGNPERKYVEEGARKQKEFDEEMKKAADDKKIAELAEKGDNEKKEGDPKADEKKEDAGDGDKKKEDDPKEGDKKKADDDGKAKKEEDGTGGGGGGGSAYDPPADDGAKKDDKTT